MMFKRVTTSYYTKEVLSMTGDLFCDAMSLALPVLAIAVVPEGLIGDTVSTQSM